MIRPLPSLAMVLRVRVGRNEPSAFSNADAYAAVRACLRQRSVTIE
jgi:hypothetical protein